GRLGPDAAATTKVAWGAEGYSPTARPGNGLVRFVVPRPRWYRGPGRRMTFDREFETRSAQGPADERSAEAFRARLEDPKAPVALELDSPGPCALVAFGGIVGALGIPALQV